MTKERRTAINDPALFARLVANRPVPDETDIMAWCDAYFEAPTHVGRVMPGRSFVRYAASSGGVDVNEAILSIASGSQDLLARPVILHMRGGTC